jgi:hypothetical protein
MPNPIDRIVKNPHVYLDPNVLDDKPEMAVLVCKIFAVWANIEREQSFLLVRVLGAEAAPAIAMYQALRTQQLQNVALQAAASKALSPEDYQVFLAVVSVLDSTRTPRNQLAHWTWAGCKQRPDLLALANPQMLRDRDFRVAKFYKEPKPLSLATMVEDISQWWVIHQFDDSEILAYTKAELERALRDLEEANECIDCLRIYLDPVRTLNIGNSANPNFDPEGEVTPELLKARMLGQLNGKRLFQTALAQIRKGQQKPPKQASEPPPPR